MRTSVLPLAAFLPLLAARAMGASAGEEEGERFFEQRIRPLLAEGCYECHSTERKDPRGGLRLDHRAGWEKGGSRGPALVPGDPGASLLLRAVRRSEPGLAMPPGGALSEAQVADLERWIAMGAPDPRVEEAPRPIPGRPIDMQAAREHWAFRALADPDPPPVQDTGWPRAPLDRFVLAGLEEAGLAPAPPADRRTWLRRASFDLTGLPPTPDEVEDFLADQAPGAFERVADRLLASPHYGERQARRWLDLARYADSNGLDENLALANAWRYRDFVVRAFAEDLAYDRFLTWQLAGDLLPESPDRQEQADRLTATGFLVLGAKMLAEQDKEKLVMDVVDEQLDVAGRAFLGLTLGCARCHDHKFDPVPTADYYALAGIFRSTSTMASLDHVSRWRERELALAAEVAEERRIAGEIARAEEELARLRAGAEEELAAAWRGELAAYLLAGDAAARSALVLEAEDFSRGNLNVDAERWGSPEATVVHTVQPGLQFVEYDLTLAAGGRYRLELRYASNEARPMRVLAGGALVAEAALGRVTGSFLPDGQAWEEVAELELAPGRNVLRLERDGAVPHLDVLLLAPLSAGAASAPWPLDSPAARGLVAGVVRGWAVQLERSARAGEALFAVWHAFAGLAPLAAQDFERAAEERFAALRARRLAGELELPAALAGLTEGLAPRSLRELAGRYQMAFSAVEERARRRPADAPADPGDAGDDALLRVLRSPHGPFGMPGELAESLWPAERRAALAELRARIEELRAARPGPFPRALAVADEPTPADLPVHVRGSHLALAGEPVPRGFLRVTEHLVPPPAIEQGSGRLELARWMTHPEHPLTSRVIVNRVWSWHFGQGLSRSTSNFGPRGEEPSHPELLDRLARDFVRGGWSLQRLQREIVLSSSYRMGSDWSAAAAALDPENRLLWRMNRRRLEAEAIRDALLAVSGALDATVGGSLLETQNAGYVTNDQSDNQARYGTPRRSLYLPIVRNAMYELFTSFDYADASLPIDVRPSTTVASQALLLMNSPLALECAERFARRLLESTPDEDERLARAFEAAFARPPRAAEKERARSYLARARALAAEGAPPDPQVAPATSAARPFEAPARAGEAPARGSELAAWQGFCQVLLASNEFVYLD